MSFNSCVSKLALAEKLPLADIEATAREHEAAGLAPDDAMVKAVQEALTMAQMQERRIIGLVRAQYEEQGGAPRPEPVAEPAPAEAKAEPVDIMPAQARDESAQPVEVKAESAAAPAAKVPEVAPVEAKAEPAAKKKPTAKQKQVAAEARVRDKLGFGIGDTVTPSQDIDYLKGGKPMTVDSINTSGEIYFRDPVRGSGTYVKLHLFESEMKRGLTLAVTPKTDPVADEKPSKDAPAAAIADFGAKLEGARKDLWSGYKHDLAAELPADAKDITLSKHFPEPNYDALIESGVAPDVLGAVKAMRDEIPTKPKMPHKLRSWAEKVKTVRELSSRLMSGDLAMPTLLNQLKLGGSGALRTFGERIQMYADLGYPLFTKASGYSLDSAHFSMFDGKSPPGGVTKFVLEEKGKGTRYFDTREQAIGKLRDMLEAAQPESKGGAVKLDLYRLTGSRDVIIGKKVAAGKFIDLKGGFASASEARAYLAAHQDELAALLEKKKDIRPERRSVNSPRVGVDRRKGEDITPEKFGETFGFRGVQFGNYVEQKRRAADLNNAYDALLDMADILGIPAKAISLNGSLGLAFGARGAGGKNAPAAHFEPGKIVINLTKTNGAGSLAHEWLHGLDNYFERMRGADGAGHVTDNPRVKMVPNAERKMVADDRIRPEVLDAFKGVMDAIKQSGMLKRSQELDQRRSKDYWSTNHELAARAFESYIIDKAEAAGGSNDYLANILGEEGHNILNEASGQNEPFPYPTAAEKPAINAAFDKLFSTIEARPQDDGNVLLASIAYHGSPHKFDQFTLDHIGTGEGAQAYGHGLYFAGEQKVADFYRRALTEESGGKGSMYKVEIPEDNQYLHLDDSLADQPAGVKEKLEKIADKLGWNRRTYTGPGMELLNAINAPSKWHTGLWAYNFIAKHVTEDARGVDRMGASELLNEHGIPGAKYADQMSRGQADQTFNYVIYNPKAISIIDQEHASALNAKSKEIGVSVIDRTVADLVKDGTTVEKVLAEIEKTGRPDQVELARALRQIGLKTNIVYDTARAGQNFTVATANADNVRGGYRTYDDTAILYRDDGAAQTMLHEIVHSATIRALAHGGLAAQQIKSLWNAIKNDPRFAGEYGASNAEEFIAEAYTSERFRQILADTKMPGSKLSFWQKLMGIVRILLGKPAVADNMLDAVMRAGPSLFAENQNAVQHDSAALTDDTERAIAGPDRRTRTIEVDGVRRPIYDSDGNQIGHDFHDQMEFWKWYKDGPVDEAGRPVVTAGQYENGASETRAARAPDIRASISETLTRAAGDVAAVRLPANYLVGDLFNSTGKISWWHKTIGTMDNLARRESAFKPVYDAVQNFIGDVSRYAVAAADTAPTLLPNLDKIADVIGKDRKKPVSAEDTKKIAAPIFEGTLIWARDANGKPVKIKDLESAADAMTTKQKAAILLQKGIIDDAQNQAWLGNPLDFYDSIISRKYSESQMKAGVVWTDAELRSMFGMNPSQVKLYREFRSAIDKSLSDLTISEMVKMGGKESKGMLDRAISTGSLDAAALMLRDHFRALAQANPEQADQHLDTATHIMDLADKGKSLIDHGYAPLSRFGKYTVYVEQGGEQVYFGMFESKAEASMMARKMTAEHPGAQVLHGTVSEEAYKLFAGISPETIELFGSTIGMDQDPATNEVYQQYLKLAKNNRSAMKRLIHRKGIAGFSEDAGRVLAGFIYSNARLTSANAHMGDIDEAAQAIPKQQGELTDAAMRLREHIKNPAPGNQLGGLMFAQFLGGSVASAMVNLTQPVAMTLPYLSQFGGIKKATARLVQAYKDAGKDSTGNAELDRALKWAEAEGIVAPQEIHYLQAQAGGKASLVAGDGTKVGDTRAALNNTMAAVRLGWGKLFSMAELVNRRVTFIAAYRTAMEEGNADAAKFAENAVTQTQGVYNTGNRPVWARGAVGGLLLTFKQYSVQYLELMSRMAFAGEPGSKERAAGRRAVLYMLATLMILGGADGLPFEQDLEDAIDGLLQRLGYNFSTKRKKQEFLTSYLGQGGADFALKGISSLPGMPIDVAGRFGMGNLIPGTGLLTKKEDYTRDLGELAGPAGDLAKRAFTGAGKLLGGDVAGAALDVSPAAVRNVAKGADMLATGSYNDARGYKVNDTTVPEAMAKMIGFQPNSTADIQDAKGQALNMIGQTRMRSKEISEHWAQGMAQNNAAMVQQARDWMHDWNEKNPDTPIKVSMPGIIARVKNMRQDAATRTQKTAPKALKATVKAQLAEVRD